MGLDKKSNGQVLYADYLNQASINSAIQIQNISWLTREMGEALDSDNYPNTLWNYFSDATTLDTTSNVYVNETNKSVILLHNSTATHTYDLTGGSRPTGWTVADEDVGASSTLTYNATDDEEDFSGIDVTIGQTAKQTITDDTTYTGATVVAGFNTLAATGAGFGETYARITLGSAWVEVKASADSAKWEIVDSEGGAVDTSINIGATLTTLWLKLTARRDGSFKTEYSETGDSSYSTLTDQDTGADKTAQAPIVTFAGINTLGGNLSLTGSMEGFYIRANYESTGYFDTDVITADATVNYGFITTKETLPSNTTITNQASANSGGAYTTATKNTPFTYGTEGTGLVYKFTLATSDNVDTPELKFFGTQYF